MSMYGDIWRSAAHSGQFWRIESELLRMSFDGKVCKTLHNTASNGMDSMDSFSQLLPRIVQNKKFERYRSNRGISENPRS